MSRKKRKNRGGSVETNSRSPVQQRPSAENMSPQSEATRQPSDIASHLPKEPKLNISELRSWLAFLITGIGFIGGVVALWYGTWSSRISKEEFNAARSSLEKSIAHNETEVDGLQRRLESLLLETAARVSGSKP
jgi:hypothetical protein